MVLMRTAPAVLLLTCLAGTAHASPGDVINGVSIAPGVERLSYISTKYYGVRQAYDSCVAATQGRVPAQGDCADEEFKFQDARLNKAYKALLGQFAGDKQATGDAQAAQRAWLAFIQKDCAARADRFGSDAAPATQSICMMDATAQRAQQLEDWHTSLGNRKAD